MTHRNDIRRMARDIAEAELTQADEAPIATWHAFSPDQLADVITGVTRSDPEFGLGIVRRMVKGETPFEFGTERRDPFEFGRLIGGALWRAERDGVSDWRLHLLQSEPQGVA